MAIPTIGLLTLGTLAFAATNLDDIFLLMLFFSSRELASRDVVLGQYTGFTLLVGVSAIASLFGLVVPSRLVALLGLVPIAIGVRKMFEARARQKEDESETSTSEIKKRQGPYTTLSKVASVTFSNGSDNIGVYVPLFALHSTTFEVIILGGTFLAMTGVWCGLGYYVVNQGILAKRLKRVGPIIFPVGLIGIGISVLIGVI